MISNLIMCKYLST